MFLPAAIVNVLPPPVAAVVVAVAAPPAVSAGSSLTPAQRMPPPGPPSAPAGGARRRLAVRTHEVPQGGRVHNSFASPDLPGTSCSPSSPDTPRLAPRRLQPVSLQFSAGAAPVSDEEAEADGRDESVRDRGSRGDERRGGTDPEGGEGEDEGGRE